MSSRPTVTEASWTCHLRPCESHKQESKSIEPLSHLVKLLQPKAAFSKIVVAGGRWAVSRGEEGRPLCCVVLDGECLLSVAQREPIVMQKNDVTVVLSPDAYTLSSLESPLAGIGVERAEISPGVFRLGPAQAESNVRILIAHCGFASENQGLLTSLLPRVIGVRGREQVTAISTLLNEEYRGSLPGREFVLDRLLEILLLEALRSTGDSALVPGLMQGLSDGRLSLALKQMHANLGRKWTVSSLAREAAMSRSNFFHRFKTSVGMTPMDYLLMWRMAVARNLLSAGEGSLEEIARKVGYSSASSFSLAFIRYFGASPTSFRVNH